MTKKFYNKITKRNVIEEKEVIYTPSNLLIFGSIYIILSIFSIWLIKYISIDILKGMFSYDFSFLTLFVLTNIFIVISSIFGVLKIKNYTKKTIQLTILPILILIISIIFGIKFLTFISIVFLVLVFMSMSSIVIEKKLIKINNEFKGISLFISILYLIINTSVLFHFYAFNDQFINKTNNSVVISGYYETGVNYSNNTNNKLLDYRISLWGDEIIEKNKLHGYKITISDNIKNYGIYKKEYIIKDGTIGIDKIREDILKFDKDFSQSIEIIKEKLNNSKDGIINEIVSGLSSNENFKKE